MHYIRLDGKKRGLWCSYSKNAQNGQVVIEQPSWRKLPPKGPNPRKAARTGRSRIWYPDLNHLRCFCFGMAMGWLPNWKNPFFKWMFRVPGKGPCLSRFFGRTSAKIFRIGGMNTHQKAAFSDFVSRKFFPSRLGDCGCATAMQLLKDQESSRPPQSLHKMQRQKHTTLWQLERYTGDKSASGHSRQVRAWQSPRFWFFWPGGGNDGVFWKPIGVGLFISWKGDKKLGECRWWKNPIIDGKYAEYKAGTWKPTLDRENCFDLFQALETNPKQNGWWI